MIKQSIAVLAAVCVLLGCSGTAETAERQPDEKKLLTLAVEDGISDYGKAGVECFVRKVKEISGGSMEIELFSCEEPLEKLEEGCSLVFGSNEQFARANGNFNAYTSPFYFCDYKHLTLTLNSPEYYDIIRNGNISLMNAMPIGAFYDGGRVIISSREKMFDTVSQFNDSVVNIYNEQPLLELILEYFGAEVKTRGEGYILENFGRRRDDSVMECDTLKLDKIAVDPKTDSFYLCKSFHHADINWLMLSQTAKEQLSDFQLAVLTEAASYAVAKNDYLVLQQEQRGFDAITARGGEIIAPSYGEFNESAMNAIKSSAKYGSLWEWDQYTEVRNLALKQN